MATITERLVSTKRHTVGYLTGDTVLSRHAAVRRARAGQISGVRVIHRIGKYYLEAIGSRRPLSDLPYRVVKTR